MGRNHSDLGIIYWELARNITLEKSKAYSVVLAPWSILHSSLPYLGLRRLISENCLTLDPLTAICCLESASGLSGLRYKGERISGIFVPFSFFCQHPVPW